MKIFRAINSHVVVDVTSTPFREPANMNIAITRTTHRTTHAPTRPSPDLRRCLSAKARHSLSATGFATAALLAIVRSAISNQLSRERAHTNLTNAVERVISIIKFAWLALPLASTSAFVTWQAVTLSLLQVLLLLLSMVIVINWRDLHSTSTPRWYWLGCCFTY